MKEIAKKIQILPRELKTVEINVEKKINLYQIKFKG